MAVYIIIIYNSLIRLRNSVKNSWAGIDVQLKRRNDLIPNLVEVVKGYAKYEKELFETITTMRTSIMKSSREGNIKNIAQSNLKISNTLKSLFAVAENYPKLKANQNFLKLQEALSDTENQIAASRRIYNENVNYFNTKLESFPNNLLGNVLGFKIFDFFEAKNLEKENVRTSF